jgi:hypothetical protein
LDILAIQGSSVPCERVFSSSKETITLRRNKLAPETIEALQLLKFSLRSKSVLDFTAGTRKEDEEVLIEQWIAERSVAPEDIHAYVDFLKCN